MAAFFLILFFISWVFVKILGYIFEKIINTLALSFINRILGAFFGFLKSLVICSVIITLTTQYNLIETHTQKKSKIFSTLELVSTIINSEIKIDKKSFFQNRQKD